MDIFEVLPNVFRQFCVPDVSTAADAVDAVVAAYIKEGDVHPQNPKLRACDSPWVRFHLDRKVWEVLVVYKYTIELERR